MIVLGLTGSIGMGKSTAAHMLRQMGLHVFDSDAYVHGLLNHGGAGVKPVAALFPAALSHGTIDRAVLGAIVFRDPEAKRRLEAILHPLVRQGQRDFLKQACRHRRSITVLDVPLLFETGGHHRVDQVVVITAPAWLQARRVLARPGMTRARLDQILATQMPDGQKRRMADYVISSAMGRRHTRSGLARMVRRLHRRRPATWPHYS